MLTRISSIMARHGLGSGAFVYVADLAMVTGPNLKALEHNRFITRLPASYDACKKAIAEAVDTQNWVTIGSLTEHPALKSRPHAEYKVYETTVDLYGISYRAVVVHSDAHDKRRQKKLEKQIASSADAITKKLKHVQAIYFCEADARKASLQVENFLMHCIGFLSRLNQWRCDQGGSPLKCSRIQDVDARQ